MLQGTNKLCLSIVWRHHVSFHLSLCLPYCILVLIFGSQTGQSSPLKSETPSGYSDFHFVMENCFWVLEYQFSLHCRGAQKRFVSITEKLGSPWASLLACLVELMCAVRCKSCSFFLFTIYLATEWSIKKIYLESYLRANCGTEGF